jgi:hypothetical protein
MKVQLPRIFNQMDPSWAKQLLGNNTEAQFNFENYGCLASSLATVALYYGKPVNPETLNESLKKINGFSVDSGEYNNGKFHELFPDIAEIAVPTPDLLTDEQMGQIKAALDAGNPVVAGIDYNPKTLAFDSHFVTLVDYDPADENNFTIADSLGGRIHSLKDYLSATVPTARQSIWKYFILKGSVPNNKPVEQAAAQAPSSALPENYPTIINQSTKWEEFSRKYFPNDAPSNITPDMIAKKLAENPLIKVETKEVEKIVEVPGKTVEVIKEVPAAGSENEKWGQVVEYLELKKSPVDATVEDVRRVIAGVKSRETDWTKQATTALELVQTKNAEIRNLTDELGKVQKEVSAQAKINKAQIDALKQATPNFDKLVRQYETVIGDLKKHADDKFGELKEARIQLAVKNASTLEVKDLQSSRSFSFPIKGIIDTVKNWVRLNW